MGTHKPLFLTLEGVDGSGKSTQISTIAEIIRRTGRDVITTREPGGTVVGEHIRQILLEGGEMQDRTELLLMFAARIEHMQRVIDPALAQGKTVICDRYLDATYAYQGYGRGLPLPLIDGLVALLQIRIPDLTLLFDVPPSITCARRQERTIDRIEAAGEAFQSRVRAGYLARSMQDKARFVVIDASVDVSQVAAQLLTVLPRYL